jgi:DUF4097 and DUF4098 domain-containing protein YvlB
MKRTFTTPEPVTLYVELRAGDLVIEARDTAETTVEVSGNGAEDPSTVSVDQRGDDIVVIGLAGRHGFFGSSQQRLSVHVTVPTDSKVNTKLGSADVRAQGRLGDSLLKSGSGDLRIDELGSESFLETGSGDVTIATATGALKVKCGSGEVSVDRVDGPAEISTGSGDVAIGTASAPVSVKSGSGDTRIREASEDVALSTASGDLVVDRIRRGQLTAKNVSGDIKVGVPAGVPVWTDITCMSGTVRSSLDGAGEPAEGQDFIELRAKTVSGDVVLEQL